MKVPELPFEGFKWRWACWQCTESLNDPPIFLGVLRAMEDCEGCKPSDEKFFSELQRIEEDIPALGRVKLARIPERNIIRNSGQYWKALGVYNDSRGVISLTGFGKKTAQGQISPVQFATTIVKTLELPNRNIETEEECEKWDKVDLKIKPLELILEILSELQEKFGKESSYLTPNELIKIVIPLSANKAKTETYLICLESFRRGKIDISSWPDCAPEANDKRVAREFLLFLKNYGFCEVQENKSRMEEKYHLYSLEPKEIRSLIRIVPANETVDSALTSIVESNISAIAEQRVVLVRKRDPVFRNIVIEAYKTTCLFTGVQLTAVLEAAHIVPASENGKDDVTNGICLRADIHLLFDSGHLRIHPNGEIYLSLTAGKECNYGGGKLPSHVEIPKFVDRNNVEWRWRYC